MNVGHRINRCFQSACGRDAVKIAASDEMQARFACVPLPFGRKHYFAQEFYATADRYVSTDASSVEIVQLTQ